MDFPAERFQHHFLDLHRPLPRGVGVRHRASSALSYPSRTRADRSLALGSGQIMYSLHWFTPYLTRQRVPSQHARQSQGQQMRLPPQQVPLEIRRLAVEHLESIRNTPMSGGADLAQIAGDVCPMHRPDLDGVAYWEFELQLAPRAPKP